MFEYLTGKITYLCPQYLVLEVQQVGYRLLVANPYRYQLNQTQTLYVEQIIRDNDQTLYGFYDLQEKELFQQLTSVAGIGPKSALSILADDDHTGLINAIVANDVQFLTQFPGVGKKTAQQIILDLKDKIHRTDQQRVVTNLFAAPVAKNGTDPILADGLAALKALGYTDSAIKKIAPQLAQMELTDAGSYVKAGLKLLQ